MLAKRIGRLCTILVLSVVSSVSFSQSLTFMDALQLIDDEGTAEIPDNYTSIGNEVFKNSGVKKVVLPSTINSIGESAFENAINLQEINLPSGISSIGQKAFYGTSSLENITIPETVTRIEEDTFNNSGIKQISLPSITYIGKSAFQYSELEAVNLAEDVYIDPSAFSETKIKNLKIPDGATLSNNSFSWIDDLVSLEIGVNVNTSSSYIFQGSGNNLKTIVTSSPIGCRNSYSGACPGDGSNMVNLEYLVFKGEQDITYYQNISHGGTTKIVLQYGSNTYISNNYSSSEVIVVSPTVISAPINSSPHSYCSGVDADEDGFPDCYDQFPNDPSKWFDYSDFEDAEDTNPISSDLVHSDSDGLADIFDTYPTTVNMEGFGEDKDQSGYELDTDYDGINNHYDIDDDDDGIIDIYEPFFGTNPLIPDSDFDGTLDGLDAFPLDNTESLDTDTDGIGNNADTDDDNDGHFDLLDAFPLDANEWMDSDLDGVGNNADTDDDNDGVLDEEDAFPYTASESVDTDSDGVGDNTDAFPSDSTEWADSDLDGIGNNADPDDDNDGVADAEDSDPLNDAIGALESQNLFVMGNPVAVNGYLSTISVGYDVSDNNNQLTGIGFRVHYDSEIFSLSAVENILSDSVIVGGMGPYQDIENFDNDGTTDSYLVFGWASINGDWPNTTLPAKLSDIQFFVNWDNYEAASSTSNINFSVVDNSQGYEANATNYSINVLPATWDFDGDGTADALTDGLMLLRYIFRVPDEDITNDALSANATLSPAQIVEGIKRAISVADIDGNGSTDALTDGLLLLRYLFMLRGDMLINNAVSHDATRTTVEEIEQYIELYMPNELTLPVQSEQNFLVGDWKLASLPERRTYDENGVLGGWSDDEIWGLDSNVYDMCVVDDIYTFGSNGTFNYSWNGSTYIHPDQNPMFSWADSNYCSPRIDPWDDASSYSYTVDENLGSLTVEGLGAYIALSHVANGNNEVDTPAEAPDSITYSFTKLSEDQILFELDAYTEHFRFTLERVFGN